MARKLPFIVFFIFCVSMARAQSTYLNPNNEDYHLLYRLETKSGAFSNKLFLSNKGVSRKDAYGFLVQFRAAGFHTTKTSLDNYNIFKALSENGEWARPNGDGAEISKYALGPFYRRRPNMLYVKKRHFFWVLNPILGLQITSQQKPTQKLFWQAAEGLKTRGRIADILGFSFSLINNNINPVAYQQKRIQDWEAIPGAGVYQPSGKGYQYILFDGNLDVDIIKNHISLNVGYGKHFIGDGIRSLFLSDYAGSSFYVGINTKIWHLNYQNLYLRLNPQSFTGMPQTIGYKYATIHYLSVNLRPWLNIGLFESVTFARHGGYELSYLNPVIFYRAIERSMGSPDKVAIGLSTKAIIAKRFNLYGQFLINEFTSKYFFDNSGYWANKWGLQAGFRYFDAFTIPNLDLQAELNMVRPFTYTHSDKHDRLSIDNFTTWNQPLAHPLGAGFQEIIGSVNYQPMPKLTITARGMIYRQGVDTGNVNFGSNIFKDYVTHNSLFGVRMINGPEARCMMLNLNFDYEFKPNLNFFVGGTYRKYTVEHNILPSQTNLYFSAGFRLNLSKGYQDWY